MSSIVDLLLGYAFYLFNVTSVVWLSRILTSPKYTKMLLPSVSLSHAALGGCYLLYQGITQLVPRANAAAIGLYGVVSALCLFVFLFLSVTALFHCDVGRATYVSLSFVAITTLSRFFAVGLLTLYETGVRRLFAAVPWDDTVVLNVIGMGGRSLFAITYVVLSLGIVRQIVIRFPRLTRRLDKRESLFLNLPSAACLCIGCIVQSIIATYNQEQGQYELLYSKVPVTQLLIPITILLMLLTMVITLELCKSLLQLQEERQMKAVLSSQMNSMQQHLQSVEQIYSGIRSLRHDISNHVQHMEGLLHQGATQELEQYFGAIDKSIQRFDVAYLTGHPVTDIIIHENFTSSVARGITCDVAFQFPVGLAIDVFDISIILSNCLDNALRAAQTYIRLVGYVRGSMFFLECENNYEGTVIFDAVSGMPISTKLDSGIHGIGLGNVQACAEKYKGAIDIRAEEGIFTIVVMMNGG